MPIKTWTAGSNARMPRGRLYDDDDLDYADYDDYGDEEDDWGDAPAQQQQPKARASARNRSLDWLRMSRDGPRDLP